MEIVPVVEISPVECAFQFINHLHSRFLTSPTGTLHVYRYRQRGCTKTRPCGTQARPSMTAIVKLSTPTEPARDAERSSGAAPPLDPAPPIDPFAPWSLRRAAESPQVRLRKGAAKATERIVTGGLGLPPGSVKSESATAQVIRISTELSSYTV